VRGARPTPLLVALVAVGGAFGGLARWGLGEAFPGDGGIPWTTFAINVLGSLALATLPALALVVRHPVLPPLLGTGLLGGFTTLSAYTEETRVLLADGRSALAAAYLLGTLAAALLAVHLGHHLSTLAAQAAFDVEEGNE